MFAVICKEIQIVKLQKYETVDSLLIDITFNKESIGVQIEIKT